MPEEDVKPGAAPTTEHDGLVRALGDLGGQNAFLRQQVGQLHDAVHQLYDAVSLQCRQLLESDRAVQQELQRFQTGGPQRAMAAVFHKLFRDLVAHVGQLDDLVDSDPLSTEQSHWLDAVRVARDHFEKILASWGCTPITVQVGIEEFDPEVHEADAAQPGEVPVGLPDNVIVKVRRRGWKLLDHVLVHPLVVVS